MLKILELFLSRSREKIRSPCLDLKEFGVRSFEAESDGNFSSLADYQIKVFESDILNTGSVPRSSITSKSALSRLSICSAFRRTAPYDTSKCLVHLERRDIQRHKAPIKYGVRKCRKRESLARTNST